MFRACGLPEADAATVAWGMLEADLTGSDAHGVFRLAGYVRQLKRGVFNPRASIRCSSAGRRPRSSTATRAWAMW